MFNGITPTQLKAILAAVEPVELVGLALLQRRRSRPGGWFPADVSSPVLAAAATEMMDYLQACSRVMEHLKKLPPVPLSAPVEEWPL